MDKYSRFGPLSPLPQQTLKAVTDATRAPGLESGHA